jgi:molybdopterin synthase catalytic subunit
MTDGGPHNQKTKEVNNIVNQQKHQAPINKQQTTNNKHHYNKNKSSN